MLAGEAVMMESNSCGARDSLKKYRESTGESILVFDHLIVYPKPYALS
jgi:hypothetical protein